MNFEDIRRKLYSWSDSIDEYIRECEATGEEVILDKQWDLVLYPEWTEKRKKTKVKVCDVKNIFSAYVSDCIRNNFAGNFSEYVDEHSFQIYNAIPKSFTAQKEMATA